MSILVDTNVLLRRTQPGHEHHLLAVESVANLIAAGEPVCFTPQNIAEFWTVATRRIANNGLGFAPDAALAEVVKIEPIRPREFDQPGAARRFMLRWETIEVLVYGLQ